MTPDLGTLSLLVDDFVIPNGLAFSPDETLLYINDSRRGHIRAFELMPNGMLAKHTDRVFADLRGDEPGVPDGMKVDVEGNVYCGGAGGIWIMDPNGKKLGRIVHGAPGHHQHRLRRRRLEDPLFHQPQPPRRGQGEDPRHPGAGREKVDASPDPPTKRAVPGRGRDRRPGLPGCPDHDRDALDLWVDRVAVDDDLGHHGVLAGRQPVVEFDRERQIVPRAARRR